MTDRSIIELLKERDERGLTEIEQAYGGRLRRIAESLLSKEDAEECVNDLYLALWKHIPPDEPVNLPSYMGAILRNLARDRWKAENRAKRRAEIVAFSEEMAGCMRDPRADTEAEAILIVRDVVNGFLKKQKPEKREMFILRYWYGMSIGEIAERYGCTVAKAEKTMTRMQAAMKKAIREET